MRRLGPQYDWFKGHDHLEEEWKKSNHSCIKEFAAILNKMGERWDKIKNKKYNNKNKKQLEVKKNLLN